MIALSNNPEDFPQLLDLWEASVIATHDFLTAKKIEEIKQLIVEENIFSHVDIYVFLDLNGLIIGFVGIANNKIEMLFILPEYRGRGIGKALTEYVISAHHVTKVDVNEQNPQAVGFYKKMGFKVINRNPLDSQGNPFPILEMDLEM
ncbi:GNAT family N-acetyltransferase [Lunatibacter salilacus]|uniref:GNAT family N-acetyltransferase n=1 Tax=Lunatibacter salilacus TaxID=2483804 RepID=UPI00131CBEDC|nr:GNAT family N-acetyltransferase [Lunatibacter salilacus]